MAARSKPQRASVRHTNGTSLSYGGLDVVLVPEQRHNAAPHIVLLLFVRRGFDAARLTENLRDDHPVGEYNAAHSEKTKKVIKTTDGDHLALGPFGMIVRQLGNVSRLCQTGRPIRGSIILADILCWFGERSDCGTGNVLVRDAHSETASQWEWMDPELNNRAKHGHVSLCSCRRMRTQ